MTAATLRPFERLEEPPAADLMVGDEALDHDRGLVVSHWIERDGVRVVTVSHHGIDRWEPMHPTERVRVIRPQHAPDRGDRMLERVDAALAELDAIARDERASLTVRRHDGPPHVYGPAVQAPHEPEHVHRPGPWNDEGETVDAELVDEGEATLELPTRGELTAHELAEGADGRPIVRITCRFCDRGPFYGHGQRTNHERAKHPAERAELERRGDE